MNKNYVHTYHVRTDMKVHYIERAKETSGHNQITTATTNKNKTITVQKKATTVTVSNN